MADRREVSGKIIAVMVEFLVPGGGHYALGARKQALFWLAASCVPWLFGIGAA